MELEDGVVESTNGIGPMFKLAADDFLQVIRHAPLVSIDLIVEDRSGRFLMGLRTNAPAKGFWFVPGGRVYKNERLADALLRISGAELGESIGLEKSRFLGLYEHLYEGNAFFAKGFGTHYVVSAFSLKVDQLSALPKQQHSAYRWFSPGEILSDPCVHSYTKNYFQHEIGIR